MLDLRTARELAGLSQDALAEETGITHVTITHLENGHHRPLKYRTSFSLSSSIDSHSLNLDKSLQL